MNTYIFRRISMGLAVGLVLSRIATCASAFADDRGAAGLEAVEE